MRRQRAQLRNRLDAAPVVTSSLSLMTGTILTSALGLVFWIVAANLYDTADFGVATTAIYTMMMLADVAALGLRSGLVRYLPLSGRATGRTIAWGYGLAAVSAGLTGIGFLVGLDIWAPDLDELTSTVLTFSFFALATACWALFNLQDAVLVSLRKAPWVPIENGIFGLLKIALLFPFADWSPGLGIFWAWTLPVFPIVVAINVLVGRHMRTRGSAGVDGGPERDGPPLREMLSFSLADWLSSIARLAAFVAIPLMVLASEGKVMAGYFNVAWIITFTVFTLSINAAHALLAENSHEQHQEQRNTVQAGLLSLGLTLPIAVVGVVGAPLLLLVYGADFSDNASSVLRILLIAAIPNVVHQIYVGRLRSQGRMAAVITLETVLSITVIGLSWVLLSRYGLVGVGLAWLIGLSILASYAIGREWTSLRRTEVDSAAHTKAGVPAAGDAMAGDAMVADAMVGESMAEPKPNGNDEAVIDVRHPTDGAAPEQAMRP